MWKVLFLLIFCFLHPKIFGQNLEVISSAGDDFKNPTAQISWSIGEMVIESYTNSQLTLNQGFHQTISGLVSKKDIGSDPLEISISPNPAASFLTLSIPGTFDRFLNYKIYDYNGQLVLQGMINDRLYTLDLPYLTPGIYIIKIFNNSLTQNKLLKFVKL